MCRACRKQYPRAIIIDPEVVWWLDKSKTYWHKSAGVFVSNQQGEFLFFKRVKSPFGLTIPAGHVNRLGKKREERPKQAAERELYEETGIKAQNLKHFKTCNMRGDECRRGADDHEWHLFSMQIKSAPTLHIDPNEGTEPMFLTLEDALSRNLTPAIRMAIEQNFADLQKIAA